MWWHYLNGSEIEDSLINSIYYDTIILQFNICKAIKRYESYVRNIDSEIYLIIVWNSFCILLF